MAMSFDDLASVSASMLSFPIIISGSPKSE